MIKACAVVAVAVLLVGCGGDGGGESARATPCPEATPGGDADLLPKDLDLTRYGTLTETRTKRGFLIARLVSRTRIVELYPPIARSIVAHDYEILSGDNEGFEAEIFFARGKQITGNLYMRKGPCRGDATLTLTYGSPRSGKR